MQNDNSSSAFRSFLVSYGMALLLVGIALGLTLIIWIFVKSFASPLFLVAVIIVAWKRGLVPAIFATLISGILIDFFFILPEYQLSGNTDDIMRLVIFGLEGTALCWLVTSRTAAAENIRESREQLLALSLRQQTLREEERKRISLEIHDELGQSLTGMKMEMHLMKQQIKQRDAMLNAGEIGEKIDSLMTSVDKTISNVRRIATELRPPILDDLGLVAAIEWQTQEFQRQTGITCLLSANVESVDVDAEFSTAIFRIFQESLTNITRHAKANTISVILKKLDQKLVLRVEDDGVGIHTDQFNTNDSLGLLGMRERARLIGGDLDIFNGEENGTIVMLTASIA